MVTFKMVEPRYWLNPSGRTVSGMMSSTSDKSVDNHDSNELFDDDSDDIWNYIKED